MISALFIGLAGSLHCVGMCGPLMISLRSNQSVRSFIRYHFGRILVYSILGLLFGLLGQGFVLLDLQRVLAIITGVIIILIYALPASRKWIEKQYFESKLFSWVRTRMSTYFKSGKRWFVAGTLNGLMPCGLIYLALAGSLVISHSYLGAVYMILFGLGTLPALALIGIFDNRIPSRFKQKFSIVYTLVAIAAGCILVIRGLREYPSINELIMESMNRIITFCGF